MFDKPAEEEKEAAASAFFQCGLYSLLCILLTSFSLTSSSSFSSRRIAATENYPKNELWGLELSTVKPPRDDRFKLHFETMQLEEVWGVGLH